MGRTLGWGVVIYAILFLAANFTRLYGQWLLGWDRIILLMVLIATLAYASTSLKAYTIHDALPHSLTWMFTAIALDALFILPQSDPITLYGNSDVWVGYILLATLPLVFIHRKSRHVHQ